MDSISAVLERLVRARDCFLEVADDGVDPTELGQIARLAAAHDDVGMSASSVDHPYETVESVAEHIGLGRRFDRAQVVTALSVKPGPGYIFTWSGCPLALSECRAREATPLSNTRYCLSQSSFIVAHSTTPAQSSAPRHTPHRAVNINSSHGYRRLYAV